MSSRLDEYRAPIDRRKKLSDADKKLIVQMHDEGWSAHKLAEKFEVSRRLIQFTLRPELLEHSKNLRRERLLFDPHRYYDKEKHRVAMADLRERKKQAHIEMYTKKCPTCGKIFIASRTDRIYCSNVCLWKTQNKKRWQKKKKMLQ